LNPRVQGLLDLTVFVGRFDGKKEEEMVLLNFCLENYIIIVT